MTLRVQARFSTVDGRGVGRWRNYYAGAEDLREAVWASRDLVPSAQVRVMDGRAVVVGPCRAAELPARVAELAR
jgi:hypothetical protein